MHYTHQPYQPGETIAAIATPIGEGGIAVIRISGLKALDVASRVFSGPVKSYKSHSAHYGHILNARGELVDDVLILPMLGTRSYTGEDTVEIHCHGGSLITRRVLDVVLAAGARQALPGEFTFKAYVNKKMDLSRAEAVQELIAAKNEKALDAAEKQLNGSLSKTVTKFQEELTTIAAILEAWVDFPEEELEFTTFESLAEDLRQIIKALNNLVKTFHEGKILHDGVALCLIGCPNVGKSSLMNVLLDKERAIVDDTPGTTRDIVEDHMRLNGLNFRLIDTAGIRLTSEKVEMEGIRRSKLAMNEADIILLVLDAGRELDEEEERLLLQLPPRKTLVVWNKKDLSEEIMPSLPMPFVVEVSAKTGQGISSLRENIDHIVWQGAAPDKEELLITNVRHKEALDLAAKAAGRVLEGLEAGLSPEFLSFDMREALFELGKIMGVNVGEDILSEIFSTFCIGK